MVGCEGNWNDELLQVEVPFLIASRCTIILMFYTSSISPAFPSLLFLS